MAFPAAFDPPSCEPLALLELPGSAEARRFEFSCRGERVPLELRPPDAGSDAGVLVLLPAPGGNSTAASPARGAWRAAGVSIASIDLPLFGARRSAKMTEMLEQAVTDSAAGRPLRENATILWQEFTRQSVLELRRILDALEAVRGERPRVALAAAGIAASVGAIFYAVDARPAAALLAGLGRHGPDGVDPTGSLASLGARPVTVLDAEPEDLLEAAWPILGPHVQPDAGSSR